jgi:RHS repeat-associated protein
MQNSFAQTYSYLGDENKILLSKNGNGTLTLFVDGQIIDEHLGEVTSTTVKSDITDYLGSVLNTVASAEKKIFGVFGERFSDVQDSFALNELSSAVIYGYAGREYDLESGLYYNRARMYSSDMGKFITKDPIGFFGGDINFYRYVHNNATRKTDPTGLAEFGKCKLSGQDDMVENPILDFLNLELAHEQLFFDDKKGGSVGYFNTGIVSDSNENRKDYKMEKLYYEDSVMRTAVDNVASTNDFTAQSYDPLKKNCQDFADALRKEYRKLLDAPGGVCGDK